MPSPLPQEPKPKMPLSKTVLALSLAGLFDLLKLACSFFVFLGPVFAGLLAASWVESKTGGLGSTVAGWFGAGAGAAVGVGTGVLALQVYAALGIVLAMTIALFGWLFFIVWFWLSGISLFSKSSRLIATVAGWVTSEIPFVGGLPTFTASISRIVFDVRREDKEDLSRWQAEMAGRQAETVRQIELEAQLMRDREELAFLEATREEELGREEELNREEEASRGATEGKAGLFSENDESTDYKLAA